MRVAFIYGLFHPKTDKCFYVGQSEFPDQRKTTHRYERTGGRVNFKFKVFKKVPWSKRLTEEKAFIIKYRTSQEAVFNRQPILPDIKHVKFQALVPLHIRKKFMSKLALHGTTASKWLRDRMSEEINK